MDEKFLKARQSLIDLMEEKRSLSAQKKKSLLKDDSKNKSVQKLFQEMMDHHNNQLSFVVESSVQRTATHKIERVFSRKEIRTMVQENLIDLYQNDEIIEAVTDVFYSWHVS